MRVCSIARAAPFVAIAKPAAGVVAAASLGPELMATNAAGIPAAAPAATSLWCAAAGAACFTRSALGPALGWLWLLAACGWANRSLRDAWFDSGIPWWLEWEWLIPLPVAVLASGIARMLRSTARRARDTGLWAGAAIAVSPLILTAYWPGANPPAAALLYGSCCAGSFASAQLMRTKS